MSILNIFNKICSYYICTFRHHNIAYNKTARYYLEKRRMDSENSSHSKGFHYRNSSTSTNNNNKLKITFSGIKPTMQKRVPADDVLSKNISFLLENLLKRYENSHLPTHGQGVPTVVKTNMLIRSMGPVSELDMVRRSRLSLLNKYKRL